MKLFSVRISRHRRFPTAVLLFLLAFVPVLTTTQAATPDLKVMLDGELLTFDVQPVIRNDRTLVPVRTIFEAMGATVQYAAEARQVTAVFNLTLIEFHIDRAEALVDGHIVKLEVAPTIIEGRTMVPLRFVAEALGAEVKYDAATRTVQIQSLAARASSLSANDAPPGHFRVNGVVNNSRTGEPIRGAKLTAVASGLQPPSYETTTSSDGSYQIDLPTGSTFQLTVSSGCYQPESLNVSQTLRKDFELAGSAPSLDTPLAGGYYRVFGTVRDTSGNPLSSVCVTGSVSQPTTPPPTPPAPPPKPPKPVFDLWTGPPESNTPPPPPPPPLPPPPPPPSPPDPSVMAYLTDPDGRYFLDLPQWLPMETNIVKSGCAGNGYSLTFRELRPSGGEGGPRSAGGPPTTYVDDALLNNPRLQKDLSMLCQWGVAVSLSAGGTGVTVCRQAQGTDRGYVNVSQAHSWTTVGQSVDVSASPVGNQPEVVLRWWLEDNQGGTLYANGCSATYVAPPSIGTAYQTSAHVLVAKDGKPKPSHGTPAYSGQGWIRILVYEPRNAPGGGIDCGSVVYTVTTAGKAGLITGVTIKGIGTWTTFATRTLTITGVPKGSYTVWITTTQRVYDLRVQMGCPRTLSIIDYE